MEQNRFFNRELSWIEFNARVLDEACRKELPLLERLQFLAIVSSNFDEFFQVRVASIKRQLAIDPRSTDSSGLTPDVLLRQISARCHQIMRVQHACLVDDVLPKLAENGISYVTSDHFTQEQKGYTQNFFKTTVFPLLTPLRIDTETFPTLGNLRLHAAFLLKPMKGITPIPGVSAFTEDTPMIAVVQIPSVGIPQVIWLPGDSKNKPFALMDDLVTQYGTQLFPGFNVEETMLFKVTRDADFAVDEDAGPDFIDAMEDVLARRQSSFAVRLLCNRSSSTILDVLVKKLELSEDDVYQQDSIIDPSTLLDINEAEGTGKLRYPEWQHFYPSNMPVNDAYWDTFKQHDVLLHVPYESYQPVIKFIFEAADDPKVLAIKMTLYRTGLDSPIVAALERAASNGKQVTCFVELKARFDEERNIAWADQLEKAGVIVVYGIVNFKVHAKILMIMRRENGVIRRYVHLSTGNYNPKTAKLYSDLSLFTTNPEIAGDATLFFNIISGYSALQSMKHLSMAPINLKSKLIAMIQREIDRSTPDNPGLIMAKMNSLSHEEIISALYRASCAGVSILLNIRGICMLIPGVPNMSENITVVSIVDRYLEHSRIFYFKNGGSEELYLSSADWMPRNLDRRVELMFPITDRKVFRETFDTLKLYFSDNTHSHTLKSDGSWQRSSPDPEKQPIRAQEVLYRKYKQRADRAARQPKIEFKVRRKN